ncbi:MAG: hypothetical protein AAB531_04920 [Patescibacteria group bacterium]
MAGTEKPRSDWIEGLDSDLDSLPSAPREIYMGGFEWKKISKEHLKALPSEKNFALENFLKCTSDNVKLVRLIFELSRTKLFEANPRSFGVKSYLSDREFGIDIGLFTNFRSEDGLETYDLITFSKHRKLSTDKYKRGVSMLVDMTNNFLKFLEKPEIPPFDL